MKFQVTKRGEEQYDKLLEEGLQFTKEWYFSDINFIGKTNFFSVMRQLEFAYWYWIDNYMDENLVQRTHFHTFIDYVLPAMKIINKLRLDSCSMVAMYKAEKNSIPSFGAVLLDKSLTKTLLVKNEKSWNFPAGKFEKERDKDVKQCAIREVLEEIGYDISNEIDSKENIIECINNPYSYTENQEKIIVDVPKFTTLYIIPNIDDKTKFKSGNYKEIKHIKWFNIDDIPTKPTRKFFLASKFLYKLKKVVKELKQSCGDTTKLDYAGTQEGKGNNKTMNTIKTTSSSNVENSTTNIKYVSLDENPEKTRKRKKKKPSDRGIKLNGDKIIDQSIKDDNENRDASKIRENRSHSQRSDSSTERAETNKENKSKEEPRKKKKNRKNKRSDMDKKVKLKDERNTNELKPSNKKKKLNKMVE